MHNDPIKAICNDVMLTFANAAQAAARESIFGVARETLGSRYTDVACEAMRDQVKRALTDDKDTWLDLLQHPLGYKAMVASIVQAALTQVIDSARPLMGAA